MWIARPLFDEGLPCPIIVMMPSTNVLPDDDDDDDRTTPGGMGLHRSWLGVLTYLFGSVRSPWSKLPKNLEGSSSEEEEVVSRGRGPQGEPGGMDENGVCRTLGWILGWGCGGGEQGKEREREGR